MIVTINGITTTHTGNPSLERNCLEERDSGNIVVVSEQSNRYEMYDKIDITDDWNTEQYLIQADVITKLNPREYQHELTLFENVAYFDTIYPASRSFRVLGQTLGEILLVYKRELSSFHGIKITYDTLTTAELNTVITFKVFDGLNFSQILQSLFRALWAVPKATRNGDKWDIYPQYHNVKNNQISEETILETWSQNNIDYATNVKAKLKNAVNERSESNVSWFPSETGWILPRSTSLEKITSKLRYELDSKIVGLMKVYIVGVNFSYIEDGTSNVISFTNESVDITPYVVQEEQWDLLPTISSNILTTIIQTDNTKNHIQYRVGDKYITNLFEASGDNIIFSTNTEFLLNALFRAIYVNYTTQNFEPITVTSPQDTEDVKLRVKYIKQRDLDILHTRKTKGAMNESTALHQQRDSSVEAGQYLRNLKFYSNRMGNNVYTKAKLFKDTQPYEVFDYTDERTIVTKVKNTYHANGVYCEWNEAENFANIEAEYAIRNPNDPYTITDKTVTTNLITTEFVEFSEVNRTNETRLESVAQRLLLGQFESVAVTGSKITSGVFTPDLTSWDSTKAIHMVVEPTAHGNLIALHVYFEHQTIAGKIYYDIDTDTVVDYLNPLPYTDTDGRLDDFSLYFTPDVLFEDAGEYPLITSLGVYESFAYTNKSLIEPVDLDSNASFGYTFGIAFVSDDWIYIGDKLARDNFLVNEQGTNNAVDIYKSTKPYGQFDQTPRTYDTDITSTTAYTYNFTTKTITITPTEDLDYFCIVKDGEILLSFNRTILQGADYVLNINFLSTIGKTIGIDVLNELTAFLTTNYTQANNLPLIKENELEAILAVNYTQISNLPLIVENELSSIVAIAYDYIPYEGLSLENELTSSLSIGYTRIGNLDLTVENELSSILAVTYVQTEFTGGRYESEAGTYLGVDYTRTENPSPVEWVIVASGTPTTNQCIVVADVGNIKQENVTTCTFDQVGGSYTSPTDLTTSIPACTDGAGYTLCIYDENFDIWACRDYEANEVTETVTYECQLK